MKVAMTANIPSATTVHFITKILSAGGVSVSDVATTIGHIGNTLKTLSGAPEQRVAVAKALPVPAVVVPAAIEIEAAAVEAPKRRRGRPPGSTARSVEAALEFAEEAVPEIPAAPKLLRRAEAAHGEQDPFANFTAKLQTRSPGADQAEKLHGVVKWFDSRTGRGSLRLTGVSGDIALDAEMVAKSGIKRLYKDQEIEATIRRGKGQPQLLALTLPGREAMPASLLSGSETGSHRSSRPVLVEVKSDATWHRQTRASAERLFADPAKKKVGTPR
jgi:cold shock CspA family protein